MESIKELRKICQPHLVEETWYVRNLPRKASIYLTRLLLPTRVSANQITLLMMASGIAGGLFLASEQYLHRLIAVAFLQLFVLFDCVDGEIARYKKQVSVKGAYLDLVINDITHVSIFLGITLGLLRAPDTLAGIFTLPSLPIIILGSNSILFSLLSKTAASYATEAGATASSLATPVLRDKRSKSLKSLLLFLHEPLRVVNIIAIAAIFNVLSLTLIGYGIFFPLWWLVSVITKFRKI